MCDLRRAATIEDLVVITDVAVFASVPPPPINAWLAPGNAPVTVVTNINLNYFPVLSSTGNIVGRYTDNQLFALRDAVCSRYISADSQDLGPVVTERGVAGQGFCNERPVACATPVVVAVP
jgi:hypothetical protein